MALSRRAVGILLLMTFASAGPGVTTSAGVSTTNPVTGTTSASSHASPAPPNHPTQPTAAVRPAALRPAALRPAALRPAAGPTATVRPAGVEPVDRDIAAGKGFIYWGFYKWDDETASWAFSLVGANHPKKLPKDGDVYGFRFALIVGSDERLPRADGDFDAICGSEEAGEGEKRIAFVLDYGTQADAPDGETPPDPRGVCATAEEDFTVQQALQTVATVRTDESGLICGIDDYPAQGCGEPVTGVSAPPADQQVALDLPGDDSSEEGGSASDEDAASSPDDSSSDGISTGTVLTLVLAGLVILTLAVGGFVLSRRRR